MSTPSPSPSPPPPQSPPTNPTPLSSKKTQPLPWTHQETTHLIQSYQEKWYSLKRGQLKASQWEEVAVTVAARCGYDYNHPSKSAVQCRHKMEKLRRRYRDEKRVVALGGTCYWQYFDLMDSLERGPLPISAQPLARVPCQENYHTRNISNGVLGENDDDDKGGDEDDDDDDDDDDEDYGYRSKLRSRSINYILRKPSIVNRYAGGGPSGVSREAEKKRKREEVEEEEGEGEEEGEEGVEMGLAGQIKAFSERMVKLERKKLEVMKETERSRMEMENKKLEMILDSHRKIVHMIGEVFGM